MAYAEGLILYKRWRLLPDVTVADVCRFVTTEIVPRYAALSPEVVLDLEADRDGSSVLAIQRWQSAETHRRATTGAVYEQWWRDYEPRLVGWDRLVDFVEEWSTVAVDLSSS